ncbi:MAG: LacI family DNA-binding transcriptional regulator [Actinomycetota bacterium]
MRVTVHEVAKLAGVSAMTVSRVVNRAAYVSPATRQRVEAAIAELGYVPNGLARAMTSRKTGALSVVVPDVTNPFFTHVLHGAEKTARQAGYRVTICSSEADEELERQYLSDIISNQADGVIIAPVGDSSRARLQVLRRNNVPFVLVDRSVAGLECDLVQGDSVGGARTLVSHLTSLGHRRIAMISEDEGVSTARDRQRGYEDALHDVGVQADPKLFVRATVTEDFEGGARAMRQLLTLKERPTAVFVVNNMAAVGAIRAIREGGLEVPGDIAVVAFDDVAHAAVLSPFLTVMAQPADMFGMLAVQLLLERITGRDEARRRIVVLPGDLIVRASSGTRVNTKESRRRR